MPKDYNIEILNLYIYLLTLSSTDSTVKTERTDTMFLLNTQSKEPIFEQIQTQIVKFIKAGVLSPGDRLPSVRQLAQENGINPNTVSKAYIELEKNGYVYNLPKKGVYVAEIDVNTSQQESIKSVLKTLKDNGISEKELIEAVHSLYKEEK